MLIIFNKIVNIFFFVLYNENIVNLDNMKNIKNKIPLVNISLFTLAVTLSLIFVSLDVFSFIFNINIIKLTTKK